MAIPAVTSLLTLASHPPLLLRFQGFTLETSWSSLQSSSAILDCVIIGGGPAGLTAAVYLSRFQRSFVLIDAEQSRMSSIPLSHNVPGWPEGIAGKELLARLKEQAVRYGSTIVRGTVEHLRKRDDGIFCCVLINNNAQQCLHTRHVILATGADDVKPSSALIDCGVQRGLIRYCAICDAYELRDQQIGVIGNGAAAVNEALFLKTYTKQITLIYLDKEKLTLTAEQREKLKTECISLIECSFEGITVEETRVTVQNVPLAAVYIAMGLQARSALAKEVGAHVCPSDGRVRVFSRQETSVSGLYAVGDVTEGLNQIVTAEAQAAVAATAIHNRLNKAVMEFLPSSSAN